MEEPSAPPAPVTEAPSPASFKERWRTLLRDKKKVFKFIALPLLIIVLLIVGLWRQGIIGSSRVATVAATVVDAEQKPIIGAKLEVAGVSGETDQFGFIRLEGIERGEQKINITKTGYEPYVLIYKLKRGVNGLEKVTLKELPIEKVSVALSVLDYISEEALEDAKVSIEDIDAIYDRPNAEYKLTDVPLGTYELSVAKDGYAPFTTKVTVDEETTKLDPVSLVVTGKIVFESNRDRGKRGLFTANYDGSDQQTLVERVGDLEDYSPYLGPNQRKVYFTSTRDGIKRENDSSIYKKFLYLIDIDGKNLTKISETTEDYTGWSPDGGYIGFNKYNDSYSKSTINTYDVVKKTLHQFSEYNAYNFAFSPDGKAIAFSGRKEGAPEYRLVHANSNGTNLTEIVVGTTANNFYSIEFVDKKIRYSRYETNKTKWYEFDLATNTTSEVTAPQIDQENAAFSPDKKLRAYVSTRDGKTNLFISDPDGKNEKKLTDLNKVAGGLLWSKDSSFLMFNFRSDDESARYLVSANGVARPKKIVDVNLSSGY